MSERFNIQKGCSLSYGISKILRNSNTKNGFQSIHYHKYDEINDRDDFFEIILFLRGNSSFMIEGTTYPLEPNDIMFAIPDELHGIIHHSSCEYERYILRITEDFFASTNLKPLYVKLKNKQFGEGNFIHHNTPVGKLLLNLFERIIKDPTANCNGENVISILTILAERFSLVSSKKIPHPLLRQIILYINNHSHEDISLNNISQKFFINRTYLARIFKEYTNTTINQYIIAERLEKARQYRFYQKMTHTDAAFAAGFTDYSAYYRAYKNLYGVNPKTLDSESQYHM